MRCFKTIYIFLLFILPVFIILPVYASVSGDGFVDENVRFVIYAEEGLEFAQTDVYRITYTRHNKDGDKTGHMDIMPWMESMTGSLPYGEYTVDNIAYIGYMPGMYDIQISVPASFKLYYDTLIEIPVVIGNGITSSLGENIYVETRLSRDPVYSDSEFNEDELWNSQSPFVERSVFGDHEDQWEAYVKEMQELGYMDDEGEYTDEAYLLMSEVENYERQKSEETGDTWDGTGSSTAVTGTGTTDYESGNTETDTVSEIEEVTFDDKEETEEDAKENGSPLRKVVFIVIAVIIFVLPAVRCWKKGFIFP